MFYFVVARTATYSNYVKPNVAVYAVSLDETIGGKGERMYLVVVNRQFSGHGRAFLACLNLNKHYQVAALLCNDVNVASSSLPVLKEYGISLPAEIVGSRRLSPLS